MMLALILLAATAAQSVPAPDTRPVPLAAPGTWIGSEDYPPSALRDEEVGTVGVELAVDPQGGVRGCKVIAPVSPVLDARTCELLLLRAGFHPTLDGRGIPIAAAWRGTFKWQIEDEPQQPMAIANWLSIGIVKLDAAGVATQCEQEKFEALKDRPGGQCNAFPLGKKQLAFAGFVGIGKPHTIMVESTLTFDTAPAPVYGFRYKTPGHRLLGFMQVKFDVSEKGAQENCVVANGKESYWGQVSDDCAGFKATFVPPVTAAGVPRRAQAIYSAAISEVVDVDLAKKASIAPEGAIYPPLNFSRPARGKPATWVTQDDYPAEAVRANMQGTVAFVLDIDTVGRVSACSITRSSGWPVLDNVTCSLMAKRARLIPATNAAGEPVRGKYVLRFRWQMEQDPPIPLESWARVTEIKISSDGLAQGCAVREFGKNPHRLNDVCEAAREEWAGGMQQTRGAAGPVTIAVVEIHTPDGASLPRDFVLPKGITIFERRATLAIGGDGIVRGCALSGVRGKPVPTGYFDICGPMWSYAKLPRDIEAPDRHATIDVKVIRLGSDRDAKS